MHKDDTIDTYTFSNKNFNFSQIIKSRRQSRYDSFCLNELTRPHRLSFNLHETLLFKKDQLDSYFNTQNDQIQQEFNEYLKTPKKQDKKTDEDYTQSSTEIKQNQLPNLKKCNKIKKTKRKKKSNGCKCTQSNCLRLHCACFKTLGYCGINCGCKNCLNQKSHEKARQLVIEKTKVIHKNAFENHIIDTNGHKINKFGCNCKTGCLKKYCECNKFGAKCSPICRCEQCKNEKIFLEKDLIQNIYKPHSRKKHKLIINYEENSKNKKNCIVFKTYKKKSLQLFKKNQFIINHILCVDS